MPTSLTTDSIGSAITKPIFSLRNYVSSFFNSSTRKSRESAAFKTEMREFEDVLTLIVEEKIIVRKAVEEFEDWVDHFLKSTSSNQKSLSDKTTTATQKNYSHETIELVEMRKQLVYLFNNYPKPDENMICIPGYLPKITMESSEHHVQMRIVAEEFLKRTSNIQYQAFKACRLNSSKQRTDSLSKTNNTQTPTESLGSVRGLNGTSL